METMKAVRIHSYGGPEVLQLEEAPRPKPGKGEVLIRVYASGVNPVDWKVREGYLKNATHPLPTIPGWDVSGVVEEVGHSVAKFKNGDAVFTRPDISRDGSYAEFIVVKESEVAHKPKSLDHVHAAAVPLAALTAWQALFDSAGLKRGQTVLIHAAAGGVGSFAVQLAKWKGAHVIGTASGRNQHFLWELGVDKAINYETTKFEECAGKVDVVFDTLGGEIQKRSWSVLRKGGILVSIVSPPSEEEAAAHGVRTKFVFVEPDASELDTIAALVDSGKLKVHVEKVLPLEEARQAQELSESGHGRGKIVLKVA